MNPSVLVAVVVLFVSVVLSQKLGVNAGSRLDDAMKLKIAKVFPKRNANYTMVVFGIIIVFLSAVYAFPEHSAILTLAYGVIFFVYLLIKLYLNVKKLRELSAPTDYVRSVVFSFVVFIGGAAAAAIILAIGNSSY